MSCVVSWSLTVELSGLLENTVESARCQTVAGFSWMVHPPGLRQVLELTMTPARRDWEPAVAVQKAELDVIARAFIEPSAAHFLADVGSAFSLFHEDDRLLQPSESATRRRFRQREIPGSRARARLSR